MSALSPFVRAFRTLAKSIEAEGDDLAEKGKEMSESAAIATMGNASLMYSLAVSLYRAATDLEQQIAADLARIGRQD